MMDFFLFIIEGDVPTDFKCFLLNGMSGQKNLSTVLALKLSIWCLLPFLSLKTLFGGALVA